jgi:hypothetical protein
VRGALGLVLLLWAGAHADEPALPPPVQVKVQAEPDTVTIGQRFRLSIELQVQPGYEIVFAQPAERLGEFDVVDFGELPRTNRGADTVITRWFTLAGFEVGHKIVQAPPIKFRRPNEEATDAPVAHAVVTVESLLAKEPEAADVRDIQPPEAVPIDWRPYQVGAGLLAVLGALGWGFWWWRRGRQRQAVAPPPRPPHEIAYEALLALKRQGLIERGEFKSYYSALSDIVRAYLEGRFGLRAPEMTTEEFLLATARAGQLDRQHRQLLGDFMAESDLVKFAKHVPTLADAERGIAAAERFIGETIPRPAMDEGTRAAG